MRSHATLWTVALAVTCLMTTTRGQLTGCVSDILFVLDASVSIGETNFNNLKTDFEVFINNMFANYPNTRVGYLVYGTSITIFSSLTAQSSQTALLTSLRGAPYPQNAQENTHIGINTAASFLNSNGRAGSPKVMVVITDSISDDQAATITAASNARNAGITVYVIGVEASVTGSASLLDTFRQELQQIASSPSLVTGLAGYSNVSTALGNLPNTICRVEIINNMVSQTVFTSQTVILSVSLNQNGITGGIWRKNGGSLPNDGRISVTIDNQVQRLTIINAQLSDAATYSFAIAGLSRSATISVTAGVFTWTSRQTRTIGGTATIIVNLVNGNCNLGTWSRNNVVVTTGGRISYTRSSNCVSHTLTITNVQLSDQGTYVFTYNGQQVSSVLTVSTSSAPVNGGFSAWTQWSQPPCSVTCGTAATKTVFRTRTCDNPEPLNGGANCTGQFRENAVTNCGLVGCPVNGGVTQWTTWNSASVACPVTCGTSAQKTTERRRTCTNPIPVNGGVFCSETLLETRTESCGLTNACPTVVNGGVTEWGSWTNPACNVTCGTSATKLIQRFRTCTNPPPSGGGAVCVENLVESTVVNCGLTGCPVNGGLSEWGQWNTATGSCPFTCGFSATKTVNRFRQCNNPPPTNGGLPCTGALVESRTDSCGLAVACPTAVNGGVGQWSAWNTATVNCPVTCGVFAVKTISRSRLCNNPPPSNGGRDCLENLVETTQVNCGLIGCPVDGGVSEWESWNTNSVQCPETCGVTATKVIERIRRCNNPAPSNGGRSCPEALVQTSTASCGTPACPVPINGGVSQWGAWSDPGCSVTCGEATKVITRTRTCTNPPPSNGGQFCQEALSQLTRVSCGLVGCPGCVSDIMFVLDASVSIGETNFNNLKTDFEVFINNTFANYPNTRVGYLVYGTSITIFSSLTAQSSQTALLTSLRGAPYPQNAQENTHIGINTTASFLNSNGRAGSPKVMVVITDSISDDQAATITAASNAKNSGITVYVIGVEASVAGSASLLDTFRRGLQQIASSPSLVTVLASYSNVSTALGNLPNTICRVEIINNMVSQTVFTSQTIILSVSLNQNGITGGIWRKNGGSLPIDGRISVTIDNQVQRLTIINAQLSDAATYSFAIAGQSRSAIVSVTAVNSGLTEWGSWTNPACNVTCGTSATKLIQRFRTCTNPPPSGGGAVCVENLVESTVVNCGLTGCPVDGGLSEWGQWNTATASCPFTCGFSATKIVNRFRQCNNPPPTNGGLSCIRALVESRTDSCGLAVACPIAVNGGVGQWSAWNTATVNCPVTCGVFAVKTISRSRLCNNPPPSNGGRDCLENLVETTQVNCGLIGCPVDGGVSEWESWNTNSVQCPETCGVSAIKVIERIRRCNNPAPSNGGRSCPEALVQTSTASCGTPACPVPINGGVSQWGAWSDPGCSVTCGEATKVITRTRTCTNPPPSNGGQFCQEALSQLTRVSCGLVGCPVNGGVGQWGQWSASTCTVTCGSTATYQATRRRECTNPIPANGGRFCSQPLTETTPLSCGLPACPVAVDGGVSQWSAFNDPGCSVTCGSTATKFITRTRLCNSPPPSNGGRDCETIGLPLVQTNEVNCGLVDCPVAGGVSEWGQWSIPACNVTCGVTAVRTITRTRTCTNPPPSNGGAFCAESLTNSALRSCGLGACPVAVDGGLSQWTQWTVVPCTRSCGSFTTLATRVRQCNNPAPSNGGRDCTGSTFQTETRSCGLPLCRINGGLSQWTQWSIPACTVTCGTTETRTVTRTRSCTNPVPQFGGRDCTGLGNTFETEVRNCGLSPCPTDGGLSTWTQWSIPQCSVTCGQTATRTVTRTRSCTNPVPSDCTGLGATFQSEERNCGLNPCPINGGLSQWTQWSVPACSVTCGSTATLTVTRTRSCSNPVPQFGGSDCTGLGNLFESLVRSCGLTACPTDGGLSTWTQWSIPQCSVTCGQTATRTVTRTRSCTNPVPSDGGRDCTGLGTTFQSEQRSCGLNPCPIDGGVTQWTQWNDPACSVTCGTFATKTVTRTRTCTNPTPQFGGRGCTETLVENTVRNCNLAACIVNGVISQWTEWVVPQCLVTCGTSLSVTATRQRFCNNPPPSNGGLNCTETRVESQIRSCGLSPCPVLCRCEQIFRHVSITK
ncbi:SCO-spondin-like isoform X2 [Haliotis asinina]|uniref:SCO-spondin-like isoform X2 n=1 Tax=Haliotis asinina TaxID=109174 RepID=UPI003532461B